MINDIYTHLAPRSFLAKMDGMSATLRNITSRRLSASPVLLRPGAGAAEEIRKNAGHDLLSFIFS